MDTQHDVLQNVLGAIAIPDAASDEREQRRVEVLPELRGVGRAWGRAN